MRTELAISMEFRSISYLIIPFIFLVSCSSAQSWIRAGYWYAGSESPIPEINSALFTHLICGFADVNSSTYQLSIPSAHVQYFSSFTDIVKRKNPSTITLLSIWNGLAERRRAKLGGENANFSVMSSMLEKPSNRKSFIESSIKMARRYGFQGIDLNWLWPNEASDMINIGKLLDEWRAAVTYESRNSSQPRLMLTMAVRYLPAFESLIYPTESMKRNLDWAHVVAYDYHLSSKENVTGGHAALYDPLSHVNTDYGIRQWFNYSFPASKLVLGLPYHGYAWTLVNPQDNNGIGAPASGIAVTPDGSMSYRYIKWHTRSYGAPILYNATYVVNY
ncbi:class V chitinase-like [Malus sylvestris]|uniref:class V chitinase-like n=1 Tax=Malus sylvestris TaxID=3752 RepID=UPI0021ACFB18|nr:class V chitinase-like [Malus sylvestris]